jgi:hypothetical protein
MAEQAVYDGSFLRAERASVLGFPVWIWRVQLGLNEWAKQPDVSGVPANVLVLVYEWCCGHVAANNRFGLWEYSSNEANSCCDETACHCLLLLPAVLVPVHLSGTAKALGRMQLPAHAE